MPTGIYKRKPLSEETKKKISLANTKKVKLNCHICKNEFLDKRCRKNIAKFCSRKCFYQHIFYTDKKYHPRYIEDRSKIKRQDRRDNPLYKEWRKKVWERDDYRCMDCGERSIAVEANHIYSYTNYPRLRYEVLNGETLCKSCHRAKTNAQLRKDKKLIYI